VERHPRRCGRPTLTYLKHLVDRLHWLKTLNVGPRLGTIARVKVEHFAAEAKSLDTARMLEMQPQKRYTLAAAFIRAQVAHTSTTWAKPSSSA